MNVMYRHDNLFPSLSIMHIWRSSGAFPRQDDFTTDGATTRVWECLNFRGIWDGIESFGSIAPGGHDCFSRAYVKPL